MLPPPNAIHSRQGIASIPAALAAIAIISLAFGIFGIGKAWLPSITQLSVHDASDTRSERTGSVEPHREIVSESTKETNADANRRESENNAAATPIPYDPLSGESHARERTPLDHNVPDRMGPLDSLDEVVLLDDLKHERHLDYWLDRLQQLPASEIPPSVLGTLAKLAQNSNKVIAERAKSLLARSPFEEFISENPFQAVEFPADNPSPTTSDSKEP